MLDYGILSHKATASKNGDSYIDLMSDSYNADHLVNGQILIVNEWYVARPDLISLAMYGDDKYGDIICKVNGISNPFELNENDIIIIPSLDYLHECLKHAAAPAATVASEQDEIKTIDKKNFQKRKDEARSANQQVNGDRNFIIDKSMGLVFY